MLGSLLYKYLQWKEERKVAIEKKNRTMPKNISIDIEIGKDNLKITKKLHLLVIKNNEQTLNWVDIFNYISSLAEWEEENRRGVIRAASDDIILFCIQICFITKTMYKSIQLLMFLY